MAVGVRDVGLALRAPEKTDRAPLAAALLAVLILLAVLRAAQLGPAPAPRRPAPRAVTLRPGETLWQLAERHAPTGSDPRVYVADLVALNRLDGAPLAGQRIRLPKP